MIDIAFVSLVAGLAIRGWFRGLVREVADLVVLVAGVILALRLGSAAGVVVAALAGTSPVTSRLIGGLVIFLSISLLGAFATKLAHRIVGALPAMPQLNRIGGAVVAGLWGALLTTIVLSVLAAVPVPPRLASQLDESAVATAVTDPHGVTQQAIRTASGDYLISHLIALRRWFGAGRLVVEEDASLAVPAATQSEVTADREAAQSLHGVINLTRISNGADPLAWSASLASIASRHALEMYQMGYLSHHSPTSGDAPARLRAGGLPFVTVDEAIALASTPHEAHDGLATSDSARPAFADRRLTRVGVGVAEGPVGVVVVELFSG